jgi:hypothetical protein
LLGNGSVSTLTIPVLLETAFSIRSVQSGYKRRALVAGNKWKSYKIIITKMFAILDKAKPDIGSIRGLNLAAVKHTTVQVTRLPL